MFCAEKSGVTGASGGFSLPTPSSSKPAYHHRHAASQRQQVDDKIIHTSSIFNPSFYTLIATLV